MNENLVERFGRSRQAFRPAREQAQVWILPQRLNEDIRKYFDPSPAAEASEGWLECAEVPTSDEILDIVEDTSSRSDGSTNESSVVKIVANKLKGAWQSKEAYLSAQYELLREDAVRPLRDAVATVRMTPECTEEQFGGKIGIYEKVINPIHANESRSSSRSMQTHVCGITPSSRGVAIRVTFSLRRVGKLVRWEQSKRLTTGGLVVLTPRSDMFMSKAVVAVVAARPLAGLEQNPPELDLFIPRAEEQELDPAVEWVMVEDKNGLFEASRHTLLALQRMMREPFPLQEHLVNLDRNISAPDYVAKQPTADMSCVFEANAKTTYENVDILNSWPSQPRTNLDPSQLEAVQRILTKRLAIVQGPPGTGKTHCSVQAIRVLLQNRKEGDTPIVIACQTNHAVDQILRHIAKFEPDFVRLGGRSKDKGVIKSRTLHEVRGETLENPIAGSYLGGAKKRMRELTKQFEIALSLLSDKDKKPLDVQTLKTLGVLSHIQAESLEVGASKWVRSTLPNPSEARSPFNLWLGKGLIAVAPSQMPEDLGFEYEEADVEMEQLQEIEAENAVKDEEDFETLSGQTFYVADHFTGKKTPGISDAKVQEALKMQDLWKIPENIRPAVYRHFQAEAKKLLLTTIRDLTKTFNEQAQRRRIGGWERDEPILKRQKIIGMTTTGFSKYRGLITALKPKIVLIEEAAETLEAPITVTCIPSLQHLILVGDHQQLRPHTNFKGHENEPYWLNVSLFERLVANKLEFTTLSMQRRMIPEVRRLLYPIYKDKIVDHPSVTDPDERPDIPGMGGVNSFFFTHQWPELHDEQMSAYNQDEVDMIVGFVEYLVYNGMETEDITVLTFYNGQRKKLLGDLRRKVHLVGRRFNVVTVDSYQGEQNEVVILSLVRSNHKGNIGFLNIDNRVCVALSRAKRGSYIFGNANMLYAEVPMKAGDKKPKKVYPTWAKVIDTMANKGHKPDRLKAKPTNRLDVKLPIRCSNHGEEKGIKEPSDWNLLHGGCSKPCGGKLDCGHPCTLKCHPFPHSNVSCQEKCRRTLPCGHSCASHCGEVCSCSVCSKSRVSAPYEQVQGFDGEEMLAQVPSSGKVSSTDSWHSFAKEEPMRYYGGRTGPLSGRTSPVQDARSDSRASSTASSSPNNTGVGGVGKKMKTLTLDLTAASTAGPSGTSPVTAISKKKEDATPTASKAKQAEEEELLIEF